MVNDDTYLFPSSVGQEIIIENEYETVVINDEDESTLGDYDNNEIVQEIYETDLSVEHCNSELQNYAPIKDFMGVWCDKSIHYLIHCRSQLSKQFKICPELKKKSLWEHVSEHMVEQGFYFDAETCETKWHDLKKMHMFNKTNIKVDEDNNVDGNGLKENTYYDNVTTVAKCESSYTTNGRNNKKICEWTIKSTKMLIQMYGEFRKNFLVVNQRQKRILWEEIAQQFLQLGYNYSDVACHNKWSNLKNTFQLKKQRASKYGSKYIRWVYYKDIDNIIKNLPKEKIISLSSNDDNELKDVKKSNEDLFNINSNFQTLDDEIIQNNNSKKNTSSLKIWTEAATECLIKLRSLYHKRFLMASQRKKRSLWSVISDHLRKNGHNYSDLECNRKWYLLKAKYLKFNRAYKKLGMIPVKWQYYQDLDRLLGVPVKAISWSLDSINYLIHCYDYFKEKLMHASNREKLLIWKQISEKMSQKGFYFSSKTCYNKWLTLKNCYIKNKMCFNRNKKVLWVHYNKMDSVLKGNQKKKMRNKDINNENSSNQSYGTNELHENNYVKTKTNSSFFKADAITELKDMITLKYTKLNQKFEKMEDELSRREKLFVDIGERTLNALDKLNELEAHLLRLLEQMILKLPNASLPQIIV